MPASELGAYLQRHREERGWSVEEVEALTRIRRRYIEAMEAGEWDALPPGVYTRGLLKNYARTLGVSGSGTLRMYVKERPHEARLPEPQLISTPLTNEPRLSFELVLAGVLLVVAVGLIAWVLGSQLPTYLGATADPTSSTATALVVASPSTTPKPTSQLPGRRQTAPPVGTAVAESGAGVALASAGSPASPGTPGTPGTASPAAGTATGAAPSGTRTATGATTAVPTAGASPSGRPKPGTGTPVASAAAVAESGLQLEVLATSDAWVLVTADGKQTFSGFVRKGEHQTWHAEERIGLRTGNAGGTTVTLNGNRLPSMGKAGEVQEREWRLLSDGNIEERKL